MNGANDKQKDKEINAGDSRKATTYIVMGLFVILYYLLSHLFSGFSIQISRISEIVYAQSLGALIADGIMFIIMWLLIRRGVAR